MTIQMNISQLYVFYLTAQHGSMAAAAEKLHVSPPAVTMHIKRLENHLGFKLFCRKGKHLEMTPLAKELYPEVAAFFASAMQLDSYIANLVNSQDNELLLGTHHIPAQYILPGLLRHVGAVAPQLQVRMVLGTQEDSLARLLAEEIHMALIVCAPSHPGIVVHPLCEYEIVLAVDGRSSLAGKEHISVQELNEMSLARQTKGGGYISLLDTYFEQHGVAPHVVLENLSSEVIKKMMPQTDYAAFFSRFSIVDELKSGVLHEIRILEGGPVLPVGLACLASNAGLRKVDSFIHALSGFCAP